MLKSTRKKMIENHYVIQDEAQNASLLGIGNGYFGIRGSLEEFGDVFIQGTYIRGVFDQIVEIPQTFADNEYMKKYYFDGQKLKEFEKEDSCINICDFLTIRFYVDGKLFLPWEGIVVQWKRYINYETGALVRKVLWDDGKGNLTEFYYERCCSFDNNHVFFQKAKAKRINHHLPLRVEAGVDTLVKTNGQHKSKVTHYEGKDDEIDLSFYLGDKYNMEAALASKISFENVKDLHHGERDQVYFMEGIAEQDEIEVRKIVYMNASVDYQKPTDLLKICQNEIKNLHYDEVEKAHLKAYRKAFKKMDIRLQDDEELDGYIRYAIYQTLIGFDRYDQVHSLSAKNLTAEKYNQFVWWDCEILQLPIFLATMPKEAKSLLMYRYKCLKKAKENAKKNGYEGAQFAFCSSVDGTENVWIYARHPFLQIHITADVGYGIINYYRHTLDEDFLKHEGLEMLMEISKYFMSRMTYKDGTYQILNVTGTDEHHPYIDNNAYTNYEVHFVLQSTLQYMEEFHIEDASLKEKLLEVLNKFYLPKEEKGIMPQFDGYLKLKLYLPLVGNGAAKGFQMKQSGLYQLSQIIKQPDVMNLFAYLNIDFDQVTNYKKNWKYYEAMCESSSSLTYPVHAICAIDNGEYEKFKKYFLESIKIDIDDLHHCAYQGVHAGCIAGAYYMVYRGIFGIKAYEDYLEIAPHFVPNMNHITFQFVYQGVEMKAIMDGNRVTLCSNARKPIRLKVYDKETLHTKKTIITKTKRIIHK